MSLVNQLILPLCLAIMMFIVGTGINLAAIKHILHQPKVALVGLISQLVLLPSIAWGLILLFNLNLSLAAGLILIASAPGGATSNMFSYLAKADVAFSVTLTAALSLIAPFWLPWFIQTQFSWLGFSASFNLSLALTIKQLLLISFIPLSLGWLLSYLLPNFITKQQKILKILGLITLLTLLVLLILTNSQHLAASFKPINLIMVISLAALALIAGYWLAKLVQLNLAQAKTLAFETGVQNAALAMLIAFSFLNLPELGFLALAYGLLMNLPAFLALAIFTKKPAS